MTGDLEEGEIPEPEVLRQICMQVEEYLSDAYLANDKYLLRQLRSKSEGYLSVKLLTSFKKIKKLTRDWRVTSYALRMSSKVNYIDCFKIFGVKIDEAQKKIEIEQRHHFI